MPSSRDSRLAIVCMDHGPLHRNSLAPGPREADTNVNDALDAGSWNSPLPSS
jgi:hypothetical protein